MNRYKIEYDRFMLMYDDLQMAINNLKNGNENTALTYLEDCMIIMKTEQDCYGKDMPVDVFRASQQQQTAITL